MMKKILLLIGLVFLVSNCSSDIKSLINEEEVVIIPKDMAIEFLNSQLLLAGKCEFKEDGFNSGGAIALNKYNLYNDMEFGTWKFLGGYVVEIRDQGFLPIPPYRCQYSPNSIDEVNKFVSALSALGIKYDKGFF